MTIEEHNKVVIEMYFLKFLFYKLNRGSQSSHSENKTKQFNIILKDFLVCPLTVLPPAPSVADMPAFETGGTIGRRVQDRWSHLGGAVLLDVLATSNEATPRPPQPYVTGGAGSTVSLALVSSALSCGGAGAPYIASRRREEEETAR